MRSFANSSVITAVLAAVACLFLPIRPVGAASPSFPGQAGDFHGFVSHTFTVDGCNAIVAEPKTPLPGRPWVWRTMFWDAFPNFDIAMLERGYYVAGIDVGDTFASPDSLKHFDAFYDLLTHTYGMAGKTVLEGLSRGGYFAIRWGYLNPTKVSVIYADAPLCDIRPMRPGSAGGTIKSESEWQQAMNSYHFTDQQMSDFNGNPIDNLKPLAKHHVPIIDVCGDSDTTLPKEEHADLLRDRYSKLHGNIVEIIKQGCDHHPHGLNDPTLIVDYVLIEGGETKDRAIKQAAPKPGAVITLPRGQW